MFQIPTFYYSIHSENSTHYWQALVFHIWVYCLKALYLVFKNWKIACKDSVKAFKIYVIVVNQFKKFKINRKQKKVILDRTLNIKSNGMKIHVWYSYMMWSSWQIVYAKEGRISPHQKEYLLLSMHTYTGRTWPAKQRCQMSWFYQMPSKMNSFYTYVTSSSLFIVYMYNSLQHCPNV